MSDSSRDRLAGYFTIAEIDRLLMALHSAELTNEDARRLEQLVRTDVFARRRYIRRMSLTAALEWKCAGSTLVSAALERISRCSASKPSLSSKEDLPRDPKSPGSVPSVASQPIVPSTDASPCQNPVTPSLFVGAWSFLKRPASMGLTVAVFFFLSLLTVMASWRASAHQGHQDESHTTLEIRATKAGNPASVSPNVTSAFPAVQAGLATPARLKQATATFSQCNIKNPNFDAQGSSGNGLSDSGQIADWIESVGDAVGDIYAIGVFNPSDAQYPGGLAPSGDTVAYINNSPSDIGTFRLSQLLVDAGSNPVLVAPNQVYTIRLMAGRRADDSGPPPPTDPPILEVAIRESGTNAVLASTTYNYGNQGLGTFTPQVFQLATGANPVGQGSQAVLSFRNLSSGSQANIDNVVASVDVAPGSRVGDLNGGGFLGQDDVKPVLGDGVKVRYRLLSLHSLQGLSQNPDSARDGQHWHDRTLQAPTPPLAH